MDNIWPEIFIVESVAIVTGNLLTIVVLSNASSLKKRGNWLIINLAVADLLIGAFSEPLYIATLKGYLKVFAIYTSVDIFLGMASVLGLTALALDRLFAVSRPFQHRTISDKAYVIAIMVIWMIASAISIVSFLASKNRFLVFFYIVLPLLTISQLLMIMSYVSIWVIVKSKRPRGPLRRREKAKLITQRESETKSTRSTSENQDQETGSVRFWVSEKGESSLLSDYGTRTIRDFPRCRSDDTGSVRDPWVLFDKETSGSIQNYLRSTSDDTGSVRDPSVLFDKETGSISVYVRPTSDHTGSVRDPGAHDFDKETCSIQDYLGSTSDDTGSVHDLQNGPRESNFTNKKMDDRTRTSKWSWKLFNRKNLTSTNNFNNFQQNENQDVDRKTENPKLCIAKLCQSDSSSGDSTRVINYCTGMIKDWKKVKSSTRKPNIPRLKRSSLRVESCDRDNKLAMTLFIATAISLVAWLPFEVMNIIMSLCVSCRVQLYNIHVLSFTKFLHYANSFVNPIIYTFRIQEFRRTMNKILKFPLRQRSSGRKTSFELTVQSSWRNKTC